MLIAIAMGQVSGMLW